MHSVGSVRTGSLCRLRSRSVPEAESFAANHHVRHHLRDLRINTLVERVGGSSKLGADGRLPPWPRPGSTSKRSTSRRTTPQPRPPGQSSTTTADASHSAMLRSTSSSPRTRSNTFRIATSSRWKFIVSLRTMASLSTSFCLLRGAYGPISPFRCATSSSSRSGTASTRATRGPRSQNSASNVAAGLYRQSVEGGAPTPTLDTGCSIADAAPAR